MKEAIAKMLKEGVELRLRMIETMTGDILEAAKTIAEAFKAGKKILLFGNGGSAADAQHIAAEFMNRFQIERPARSRNRTTEIPHQPWRRKGCLV